MIEGKNSKGREKLRETKKERSRKRGGCIDLALTLDHDHVPHYS